MQCATTLASTLVENRFGQFYLVQFREPEWIGPDDPQYAPVAEMAVILAEERIERTFDYESALITGRTHAGLDHGRHA